MKKYLVVLLAVLLTMGLGATAMAQYTPGAGIDGSPHDLRGKIPSEPAGSGEICVVCHTPHNAMTLGLLWNHDETANVTFTLYSSVSLDAAYDEPAGTTGNPTGISKLCLGCHDGSTAVDAYGDVIAPSVNISTFGGGAFTIGSGGDLSTTHPVSITYPDNTTPADGNDLEINSRGLADFGAVGGSGTVAEVLEGGIMQCSSCHDVHNGPETADASLLRGEMTGSGLCLVCHLK